MLNNGNKERRIRHARLRNLNNTYLVPQEDTILVYINSQPQKYGIEKAIVIDAENTDVVLAAYVAHHAEGNLHLKRKGAIFDRKKEEKNSCADYADVIVSFHIRTGAVAVSGFYGHSNHLQHIRSQEASKYLREFHCMKMNFYVLYGSVKKLLCSFMVHRKVQIK